MTYLAYEFQLQIAGLCDSNTVAPTSTASAEEWKLFATSPSHASTLDLEPLFEDSISRLSKNERSCGAMKYQLSNKVGVDGNTHSFVSIQGDQLVLECDQLTEATGDFTVYVEATLMDYSVASSEKLGVTLVVDSRCAASAGGFLLSTGAESTDGDDPGAKLSLAQVIFVVVAALVIFGIGMCIAYLFVGPRRPAAKPTAQQNLQMANQGKVDFQDTQQITFDDLSTPALTPK